VNAALRAPLMSALLRSRAVRDLSASLVAYLIAGVLFAIALGFLVATLYLALTRVVQRPLAALLTSLILGVVACLVLLVVRLRRRRRVPAGTVGVEALLLSVTDQVRRDPWSSIVIAAALGAIAEVSRSASASRPPT
jgi:fructose-specific phosphotransferase system IIC component